MSVNPIEADYEQSLIWRIYRDSNYIPDGDIEDGGDMLLPVELLPIDESFLDKLMAEMTRYYEDAQLSCENEASFQEIEFNFNGDERWVVVEAHFEDSICTFVGIHVLMPYDTEDKYYLDKSVFFGYSGDGSMKAYWRDTSISIQDAIGYDPKYNGPFLYDIVEMLVEALRLSHY